MPGFWVTARTSSPSRVRFMIHRNRQRNSSARTKIATRMVEIETISPVAGQADVLVVPDLESGNMLAKQLIYMGEAASAGIVLGAKVPIVLTSRADSRQSRIASCAIALMLAHRYRAAPP